MRNHLSYQESKKQRKSPENGDWKQRHWVGEAN